MLRRIIPKKGRHLDAWGRATRYSRDAPMQLWNTYNNITYVYNITVSDTYWLNVILGFMVKGLYLFCQLEPAFVASL